MIKSLPKFVGVSNTLLTTACNLSISAKPTEVLSVAVVYVVVTVFVPIALISTQLRCILKAAFEPPPMPYPIFTILADVPLIIGIRKGIIASVCPTATFISPANVALIHWVVSALNECINFAFCIVFFIEINIFCECRQCRWYGWNRGLFGK